MIKVRSQLSLGPFYFTQGQKMRCVVQLDFEQSTSFDTFSLYVVVNAIDNSVVLISGVSWSASALANCL